MFTAENLPVTIDVLNDALFYEHNVSVSLLRLDAIHPVISGNKIFKLHYFLQDAINSAHKKIITFGGAYSNHLAAAAFACKQTNLQSIAIVRGEKPKQLSHTLQFCISNGMQLQFISRSDYKKIHEPAFNDMLKERYGAHVLIPEGGFEKRGAEGAAMICKYYTDKGFTHACVSAGTATTLSGIISCSNSNLYTMAFSALKNINDIEERLAWLGISCLQKNYTVINEYHFGGYAKKNAMLISFVNEFYHKHNIALDFVYTGKMMFGVYDLIQKKYFAEGSKIICIHTGGLQGNGSLPKGTLAF